MHPSHQTKEFQVRREEILESIRDNRLVAVTGTGVSMASLDGTDPSSKVAQWQGLLENGLVRCEKSERIKPGQARVLREQIQEGSVEFLLSAAQMILDRFDSRVNEKAHWLRETVGALKVDDNRKGLIKAIAMLGRIVATLNYDGLLTEVTGLEAFHWCQNPEVVRLLRNSSSNFVLHLHGHWESPDSVVLDSKSYERICSDQKAQTVQRVLMYTKTLLFVGCRGTFEDPNFSIWLGWSKEVMNGLVHRHYILCKASEERFFLQLLAEHGYIVPLVYGENHDDLEDFLIALARDATSSARIITPPSLASYSGILPPAKASKPSDIRRP